MFDYKLLEAMATVAREGGFDRAARALHLTQSAVSQRVKLLEEQTGRILLVRTTPPRLTEPGKRLLKHFLQVKRLEEDLLDSPAGEAFTSISVGVNADSLATWFLNAAAPFVKKRRVLLDLSVDDQEQTHQLLKDGEVMGCVSDQPVPMQGCRVEYLGRMDYRLLASPGFAAHWFPDGLNPKTLHQVPFLIFNRKDDLLNKIFQSVFDRPADPFPAHYIPSSEKFVDVIGSGLACGMLPDLQAKPLIDSGKLIDLAPEHTVVVHLYWHCWNLKSGLLNELTEALTTNARKILGDYPF